MGHPPALLPQWETLTLNRGGACSGVGQAEGPGPPPGCLARPLLAHWGDALWTTGSGASPAQARDPESAAVGSPALGAPLGDLIAEVSLLSKEQRLNPDTPGPPLP